MIRRSTVVFLTCLAALGVPATQAKSAPSAPAAQESASQVLIAQAAGSSLINSPLGIGSRGEAVNALQRRLQQTDYYNGPIDGLYGLDTQRAVIALQADQGLDQTGSMTDETWSSLQALSTQAASPPSSSQPGVVVSEPGPSEGGNGAETTATAPTASELPPLGGSDGTPAVAADTNDGGLGKIFGLSLGLVALLSSFGVGFYLANRSKSETDSSEEGGWGTTGGSQDADITETSTVPVFSPPSGQIGGNAALNTGDFSNGNANGSAAITTAASGGLHSGQIGGTSTLAPTDLIEGLIGDLRNPDPTQRRKAIWELGQRGNSLAMQPLVDSMINADSKEKSLVLAALSEIGIRSLKPMSRALAIALQDDNPEVRKNGIRDLSRVYDLVVQISQMLGHATEDEDPEVRQTAAWALDNLSRIRQSQDLDSTVRAFSGGGGVTPIDLLSSEASMRRNTQ